MKGATNRAAHRLHRLRPQATDVCGDEGRTSWPTIQEVADAYGISKNHLMKVAYDLGQHDFIETVRGRGGGGLLLLARPAAPHRARRCRPPHGRRFHDGGMLRARADGCRITRVCRLKGALGEALTAYLTVLDKYTLADLTGRNPALGRILMPA